MPSGEAMPPEDYRALMAEFLRHGVDPISIGRAFVSLKDNDFSILDQNLEFCFARGLQLFEIPRPGEKLERLKPLVEHLRKKGWIDKALIYSNQDEPDTGPPKGTGRCFRPTAQPKERLLAEKWTSPQRNTTNQ